MIINSSVWASSSSDNGSWIPIIVNIFIASWFNNADCIESKRDDVCNLINIELIISVKASIPAITIHYYWGGTEGIALSIDWIYLNKSIRFAKNQLHSIFITSQRVVSWGHIAFIQVINSDCCRKCWINDFIIFTISLPYNSVYACFKPKLS